MGEQHTDRSETHPAIAQEGHPLSVKSKLTGMGMASAPQEPDAALRSGSVRADRDFFD
jgi:hypothetical protein